MKYISISQLAKLLNITNEINKKPLNYVLRYWEKEFKQIKPILLNKRRYYSKNQVEIIKLINFLLKNKGMTIKGVKNILNKNINKLDDYHSYGLKASYYKKSFKEKTNKILKNINRLKRYGKKNTYKN